MWSEIRRPGSLPFMQEDKEKSQHCASLLVTQHCGVACCPLIVVPLLLLAANAVWPDKAAALLQQMMDVFLIQFSAHFLQPPEGRQSKSKQTRLSSQKIWPETLSLSSSTNLEFSAICELQIQSNAPPFSLPRTWFFDVRFVIEGKGRRRRRSWFALSLIVLCFSSGNQCFSSSEIRDFSW